jgi:cytochrome c551/c552
VRRRLALLPAIVLLLAACGGGETVRPLPETVIGPINVEQLAGDAASGKTLFASEGCAGCHEFEAAGSTGKIGPSLDDVAAHADDAGQDLPGYVKSSIVNPNAYVVEGYEPGVMPAYQSLEEQQIADLVAFIVEGQA